MKLDLDDVLSKLYGLRRTRNGWNARCPSHYDNNPSLSIKEDDGKLLLYCHAGCTFAEIVQALENENEHEHESKIPESTKAESKKIAWVYDYLDEFGNPKYQIVRFEPKGFAIRRLDENGNWIWNLDGVERVPYNLAEVTEAKDKGSTVFICEGEKDADNLKALGLTATTTALGVNGWSSEYAKFFGEMDIVILPDNDEAGEKYAAEIVDSLAEIARSIKIVRLPDLEEKADVSDWICNGGTCDGLMDLVNKADDLKNAKEIPQLSKSFIIKSANAFLSEAKDKTMPRQLFDKFWFEGELSILFADTNVGKSILAVQVADSISKGKPIGKFVLEVEAQKILYFDFELNELQFALRYSTQEANKVVDQYRFSDEFLRAELNPDADFGDLNFEDVLFQTIESYQKEFDLKFIIIDNLTYLKSDNEQAKEASSLMKKLKALKSKLGLSILVLAHTPKRDLAREISINDLAGSKMLMNFCDSAFAIGKSFKDENLRYIKQVKVRNSELIFGTESVMICEIGKEDNFLKFIPIGCGSEIEHLAAKTTKDLSDEIKKAKSLARSGKSQRNIAEIMGVSVGKVNKLLNSASNESNVQTVPSVQSVQDYYSEMNDLNIVNNDGEMGVNS